MILGGEGCQSIIALTTQLMCLAVAYPLSITHKSATLKKPPGCRTMTNDIVFGIEVNGEYRDKLKRTGAKKPSTQEMYPDTRLLKEGEALVLKGKTITNLDGRNIKSWQQGVVDGRVFVDDKSGTVILSANVATKDGMLLQRVEIPYKRNANGEWRADFTAHDMLTRTGHGNEVTVEPFHPEGKVESESRMRTRHFSEANEKLAKIWKTDPDNAIKDTLDLGSIKDVTKGKGVSPGIYTWHHVDAQEKR